MENTHEFVKNFNERKKKAEKNKKGQGNGHPEGKLPNKQHDQGQ